MRKSLLSWDKQSRLIELFGADTKVRVAASLGDVNTKTASYYFQRWRELIYGLDDARALFEGETEVNESCYGGKRGRGTAGKVSVCELLKKVGRGVRSDDAQCEERRLVTDHA